MLAVPEAVRRKALALGPPGEAWLDGLGALVAELEAEWGLVAGPALDGGSSGFVAEARAADGERVILKVAIPDGLVGNSPFAKDLRALRLGDGVGYVRVLHADLERRAMVIERLGRPLLELGLPVEEQIDVLAATMARAWRPVPGDVVLPTGADQAAFLIDFITARWSELDRPCSEAVVERAVALAARRRDAYDPDRAVLVHGDAHPGNVLEAGVGRFKLVDPDAMRSEPAHDLAIPLRDWTEELLGCADPVAQVDRWCARLAARTGVAEQPIWEWAFVERVSTGLFLVQLGDPSGAGFLEIAERLVSSS